MNDNLPIQITDTAFKQFKLALEEPVDKPFGIRIGVRGGGCSGFMFNLDFIQESDIDMEDTIYTSHGINFIIDMFSESYLKDMTIDYVMGLKESGFKFTGGSIKRTCGCGSSFSV